MITCLKYDNFDAQESINVLLRPLLILQQIPFKWNTLFLLIIHQ